MTIDGDDAGVLEAPGLGNRLVALVDYAASTHRRACALLALLALLCFLPGFFNLPTIDRDEARFAQATKQMLETGDFVDIRFQSEARHKKPVGIYWLQAAVVGTADALGVPNAHRRIWLYRIPSLIGAIGGVLLTYWTALAFVSRRSAVLAAAMLASCVLLGVEARMAKTDAMLFLTVMAAQGALAHAFQRAADWSRREAWLVPAAFWTGLGCGILLKGPIIVLVVGLTLLGASIATRSWRWMLALKPAFGLPWVALIVLPWFIAITLKTGGAFYSESVGRDLIGKLNEAQEKHWGPPGYYLIAVWVAFWPAMPLAWFALPSTWRDRFKRDVLFLLAWLVPCWLIFEIVPTKLPHYMLPLVPALAILAVRALEHGEAEPSAHRWTSGAEWWWPGVAVAIPSLALIGLLLLYRGGGFLAWPFMFAAGFLGFKAVEVLRIEGTERGFLVAIITAITVYVSVLQILIPATRSYFPAATLVATAKSVGCADPKIASVGYHEPSLVFFGGTDVVLTDATGAVQFLRDGACRVAIIESRHERTFALRAEDTGLRYRRVATVKAANYNGGRWLQLQIFTNAPD